MLKPLLKTIPTMSGNVKLACSLSDYIRLNDTNIYECNVRGAKLLPLASSLKQYNIKANLLGSAWDYDLKTYYVNYSDVFFDDCFNYSKEMMGVVDMTQSQYFRNTDFEYGVKRVSYIKNGAQYAFFAPIYVESENDIPDYFDINLNFSNKFYNFNKIVRVNIGVKNNKNYLYNYLHTYCAGIDNNVAYMNHGAGSIVYDGIDLVNGGMVKKSDVTVKNIYKVQLPMQKLDGIITSGFKRNKMCIKQVIPLCFYINIDELFKDDEKYRRFMQYCTITFSGQYSINGNTSNLYDFSSDYDEFNQSILKMDPSMGFLYETDGDVNNLMGMGFPALFENRLLNYQFVNKLGTDITRWKLKYSDDSHPYINNLSWVYSSNQGNNYIYREFPTDSSSVQGVCVETKIFNPKMKDYEYVYNLIYPIEYHNDMKIWWYSDTGRRYVNKGVYDDENYKKYATFINNYSAGWFDITKTDISLGDNHIIAEHWEDVDADGKVYYNGILYNLNNIYSSSIVKDSDKIDRFGVFVHVNTKNVGAVTSNNYKFSDYGFISYDTTFAEIKNTNIYGNIVDSCGYIGKTSLYTTEDRYHLDDVDYNTIYKEVGYIYTDKETLVFNDPSANTSSVDIEAGYVTGLDYYELNNYYSYTDISPIIDDIVSRMKHYAGGDVDVSRTFLKVYRNLGLDTRYVGAYIATINDAAAIVFDDKDYFNISYIVGNLYIPSTISAPLAYTGDGVQSYITALNKNYLVDNVGPGIYRFNDEGFFLSQHLMDNDTDGNVVKSCSVDISDISQTLDYGSYLNLKWNLHNVDADKYGQYVNNLYDRTRFVDRNDMNSLSSEGYPVSKIKDATIEKITTVHMILDIFKEMFFDKTIGFDEYEYHQDLINNSVNKTTAIGGSCFTKRGYLGRKYEDNTTIDNMEKDRDVLYVRPYNIYNLIDSYNEKHKKKISKSGHRKESFYSVALNKNYLWSWYAELYKNETRKETGPNEKWKDQIFVQEKVLVHTPSGIEVKYKYTPITSFYNIKTFDELMSYIRYDYNHQAFTFNDIRYGIDLVYVGDVRYAIIPSLAGTVKYDVTPTLVPFYTVYDNINLRSLADIYSLESSGADLLDRKTSIKPIPYFNCELNGYTAISIDKDTYAITNKITVDTAGERGSSSTPDKTVDDLIKFINRESSQGRIIAMVAAGVTKCTNELRTCLASIGGKTTGTWDVARKRHIFLGQSGIGVDNGYEFYDDNITDVLEFAFPVMKGTGVIPKNQPMLVFDAGEEITEESISDNAVNIIEQQKLDSKYFNICISEDYFRMDEDIWTIMNTPDSMGGDKPSPRDNYIDMYIHRPYRTYEYDNKFYKKVVINSTIEDPLQSTMKYIGLTESYKNKGGEIYSDVILHSNLEDTENCLFPMFNSIFKEEEESSVIWEYVHFDEIGKQKYVNYATGDTVTNYRYNSNNTIMMIKLNLLNEDKNGNVVNVRNLCNYIKSQRNRKVMLPDIKLYNMWSGVNLSKLVGMQTGEDMMGYNDNTKIHVFRGDDGKMYGYYYINVDIDNTYNTFNMIGLDQNNIFTSVDDEYHSFKILKYINYTNIEENPDYIVDNFKRLLPFINTNLMGVLSEITTIYKPTTTKLETYYYPQKDENEYNRYIVHTDSVYSNQKLLLQRYLDAIVPYIAECKTLTNLYFRKMKDIEEKLIVTGKYNHIGDSVIYKESMCAVNDFPGYRVYTNYNESKDIHDEFDDTKDTKYSKSYNIVYNDKYYPVEYKYFNDSVYHYMPVELSISLPSSYTYEQVLEIQDSDDPLVKFGLEINKNYNFSDNEILFLYNKYDVTFDTDYIGLDTRKENKLYTITYKYRLL